MWLMEKHGLIYYCTVRKIATREIFMPTPQQPSILLENQPGPRNRPRLVIVGSSTLDGRGATLLRMRPSLLEELETYATGPLYLLIDLAVQDLVARLKETPEREPRFVAAESMDPSVYDRSLLIAKNRQPKPRKAKKPAVADSSQ